MAGNSPIDRYLSDLRENVRWHRQPDDVVAEAADHLRQRADDLVADGTAPGDAEERAIAEYGTPQVVADAHLRASRRPAVPTKVTRDLGTVAIIAGLLWMALPALTAILPDELPWWGILATMLHGAVVLTVAACVGLWLRHGGLGWFALAAVVPAVLAAPFVLFVWPIPAWSVLLGLASLLFGFAVIARGVAPLAGSIPMAFGLALTGGTVVASEFLVDKGREDFAFMASTMAMASMVAGMIVFGVGLVVTGRWLRSETPVAVPALPAPPAARPTAS